MDRQLSFKFIFPQYIAADHVVTNGHGMACRQVLGHDLVSCHGKCFESEIVQPQRRLKMATSKKKASKSSQKDTPRIDSMNGEFAILKIAFLLAALDGKIDETEREMYDRLAEQCKDIDVDQAQKVLKEVDAATKRLLDAKNSERKAGAGGLLISFALVPAIVPEERVQEMFLDKFMKEAEAVCDWPSFVKDSSRVRRAFVMWTAMAMADGDYAAIERKAIERLRAKVNSYELISKELLDGAEGKIGEVQKLSGMIGMARDLKKSAAFNDRRDAILSELDAMIRG